MSHKIRRILAIGTFTLLTVTACSSDGEDASSPTTGQPAPGATASTVGTSAATTAADAATTDASGTADDRIVVALDELTALSMSALGVAPDVVLTTLGSESFGVLAEEIGADVEAFDIAEPSLEQLATFDADLFIGVANPNITDRVGDYEAIAPTVLAPLEGTWQEQLMVIAEEFDVVDRADAVVAAVAERSSEVAAELAANRPGLAVSILTGRVGTVIAVNSSGAVGTLLTDVGIGRPEPQQQPGAPGIPFVPVAGEQLTAHDADILLLAAGPVFDLSPITESPLYPTLSAVADGSVHEVVGDHWVLGGSSFASWWILEDLSSLARGSTPATIGQTIQRWNDFLDAAR